MRLDTNLLITALVCVTGAVPRLAGAAPKSAAPDAPADFAIAVLPVTTGGLEKEVAARINYRLETELTAMGLTLSFLSEKHELKKNCLETPACARGLTTGLKVAGILSLRFIRVGPTVQVTVRVLRADTGAEVRRGTLSTNATDFPDGWNIRQDLGDMLSALPGFPEKKPSPTPPPASTPVAKTDAAPEPTASNKLAATTTTTSASPPMTAVSGSAPPPAKETSLTPWLVAGAGVLVAIGGGTTALIESRTLNDQTTLGTDKDRAREIGRIGLTAAGVGVIALVVGGVLALTD